VKLIVLSLIMGFIGLNIGGMISGAEIYAILFGIVGVLSPGFYVLERIYKELKVNKYHDEALSPVTELELLKLEELEVLSNSQLEEIREIYKKNADKNDTREQYQRSKQVLDELKQAGHLNNEQYFTALDKLEANHGIN